MTVFVQNTALTNTYDFWRNRTNELADAMSTKTITVNSNTTTGNAVVNGTFQANNLHIVNTLRGGNNSTSTTLTITSNLTVNGTLLTVGNSTVNVTTNSTQITIGISKANTSTLSVGANVIINSSVYFVGNSTVNTVINSTSLFTNSIIVSTVNTSTINASTITVGSNVSLNTSTLFLGNSTVNTVITSNGITVNALPVVLPTTLNVQTTGTGSQVIDSFLLANFRGAEYTLTIRNNSANGYQITKALVVHDSGDSYITEYGTVYSNNNLGIFTASVNSTHSILSVTPTVSSTQVKGTKSLIVV